MAPPRLAEATALMRSVIVGEIDAGFPRLRRIPCSTVIKAMDYWAAAGDGERAALLDARVEAGALTFCPPRVSREPLLRIFDANPAFQRFRKAMFSPAFGMGLRYQSLRDIAYMVKDPEAIAMRAQTRATLTFTPRDDLPPELVADPDLTHVKPAKAPQLRKLLATTFKRAFAAVREKRLGGVERYSGVCEDAPVAVDITYTNRGPQFLYGVRIVDDAGNAPFIGFNYEQLWGGGGWDLITEEKAEEAIVLLGDLVCESVRLRRRMVELLSAG